MLIALTGNIDKLGGNIYNSIIPQTPLPTIKSEKKRMAREQYRLFPVVPYPAAKEAILNDDPFRPRAMIVHHSNPVLVQGNQERTKQALQKLDFLMVLDVFPTATTEVADLVLPAAADFEAVDYRAYSSIRGGFVAFREKVFEPMGESRSVFSVEYQLAKRMGIEKDYPFRNNEEWIDFVLRPAKITVDDLRKNHIIYATPPIIYRKYKEAGFKTPSGKVECLSQRFRDAGQGALPAFVPPKEASVNAEYPLLCTTRRPAEFVHTKLVNLPVTGKRYPDPLLMIHPEDAESREIHQDDLVEARSPRGAVQLKAKVTENIGPGMVSIDFGWGNPTDEKPSINLLTSDSVWDPVSGGYPNRLFVCEVGKATDTNSPSSI
jgi:anaerobic selenocysteine-containing dehydrogenase